MEVSQVSLDTPGAGIDGDPANTVSWKEGKGSAMIDASCVPLSVPHGTPLCPYWKGWVRGPEFGSPQPIKKLGVVACTSRDRQNSLVCWPVPACLMGSRPGRDLVSKYRTEQIKTWWVMLHAGHHGKSSDLQLHMMQKICHMLSLSPTPYPPTPPTLLPSPHACSAGLGPELIWLWHWWLYTWRTLLTPGLWFSYLEVHHYA